MTITLNQIILFFLHQNQNIFFSNTGNQNIFLEKKHNPPPLEVKWSVLYSISLYLCESKLPRLSDVIFCVLLVVCNANAKNFF